MFLTFLNRKKDSIEFKLLFSKFISLDFKIYFLKFPHNSKIYKLIQITILLNCSILSFTNLIFLFFIIK